MFVHTLAVQIWAFEFRGAIARWTTQWRSEHARGAVTHYVPIKQSLLVEAFASPDALLSRDYERFEILGVCVCVCVCVSVSE